MNLVADLEQGKGLPVLLGAGGIAEGGLGGYGMWLGSSYSQLALVALVSAPGAETK